MLGTVFNLTGVDRVMAEIEPFTNMLFSGTVNLLWLFMDLEFTAWLLGIVIAIEAGLMIYKVVMWIIKKIPFINIH